MGTLSLTKTQQSNKKFLLFCQIISDRQDVISVGVLCNVNVIEEVKVARRETVRPLLPTYPCCRYINSDLGYVICSSYITTLLSHSHIKKCRIRTHLVLVLCNLCVISQVQVVRSLLHHNHNIYPCCGRHINSNSNSNLGYMLSAGRISLCY